MTNSIFKTSHLNKLSRLRALARACAISSILAISTLAAQATANYVYHEQTANDLTAGAPNTCGGAQAYVPTLTPNSSQAYLLRFKIEYQFYTDTLKVYYTTDGSSPSGALGVPSGTTVVVNGSYQCTFTFAGNTIDVGNATIPAQPAGTVVKYIISARHSGGGPEIFANSGEFSSPFTTSAQATVFQYTVGSTTDLYWDSNGSTAGAGGPTPTGTWGTSTFWSTVFDGTAATAGWTSGRNAVFSAGTDASGTFTVTVSGIQTASGIKVEEGTVSLSGGTLALTGSGTYDVASGLVATNGLTVTGNTGYGKTGAGRLVLTSSSSAIIGPVSVTGGILEITASGNIGGTSVGAGNITLDGGVLRNSAVGVGGTFLTGNRGLIIGPGGGTLDVNGSAATILVYTSGSITGPGNTLTKTGIGTFRNTTPTATTFSKLVVNGGLYQAAAEASYGAVPGSFLADAITLNGGGIGLSAGISFVANRGITIGASGGIFDGTSSATVAGKITGAGTLTKTGTGTYTLTADNSTSFTGPIVVSGGVIAVGSDNALGDALASTTVSSGAAVNVSGTRTVPEPLTLNGTGIAGAGALRNTANANTWSGAITLGSSGVRINSDAATLTASGGISGSGNPNLSLGGAGSVTVNTASLNIGSGTLTWDGTTQLRLDTANTMGAMNYNSAIVKFNHNTAAGSGTITVNTPAGTGEFSVIGGFLVTMANNIVLSPGANPQMYAASGGSLELTGQISGSGALRRTDTGAVGPVFSGNNTFSGGYTINSRDVTLGHKSGLGTGIFTIGNPALAMANLITIKTKPGVDLTGANAMTNAITVNTNFAIAGPDPLEFTGAVTLAFSPTITVSSPVPAIFSGPVTGTGFGLTKAGAGTLALKGNATYSGPTIVSTGTLQVNGSLLSPSATVNSGATLSGSGSISGPLVINGAIAPGTSPGTIFTGNESWNGGGSYIWEINLAGGTEGADPGWDLIDAGPVGALTISATPVSRFTIKITSLSLADTAGPVSDFNNANEYFWRILKAGAGITGFDPAAFTLDTSAFANSLAGAFFIETADGGTSLRLHYIPAPLITQQPVPASAECGLSNAVFSVTATGPGPLSYQWRRNGSDLGGATGSTLAFSPATAADAGNYSVVVCNPGGCVTSTVVALTVPDTTPPFVNCGQHETVSCMQGWGFTVPIVIDNCDAGLVPVALSTVTNFGCGYTFEATRIWQVTDSSANVTYCTQLVSYVDFIPPTITACPPNVTVGCLTAVPPPDVSLVTATNMFDPCETVAPVVTHFGDVTNGVGPVIITRTYRASDACGNYSQCIQTITVQPAPPVITCGTNKTVECASAWSFDEPTASSPCCGTNVTITILDTVTNGVCPQEITRTWQATDCLTNSASCSQIVTVVDTTPPTLTCATNKTVECGSCASGTNAFAAAVLKDFANTVADGWFPDGPLVRGPDGAWYGTALAGGNNNFGVIFKINSDGGGYTALHYFNFTDGRAPFAGLHLASDGAFYGTTYLGGSSGKGVVFKMNPDGSGFTVLHQFSGGSDGSAPYAGVIEANNGVLYGVTAAEGANGPDAGTLFRINKDGSGYAILHQFGLSGDGYNPVTDLLQASDGALYGVTTGGGSDDFGVLFKIALDGSGYTLVHQFSLAGPDAHNPQGVLVEGGDGALYGTASAGGTPGNGAVFKVNKDGSGHILLHQFSGTDGSLPSAGLLIGQDGALYGAAYDGGDHSAGTAFRLNQDGSGFRVISHLGGPGAPANPAASLAQGADGALYGTSVAGGPSGFGTVFRLACTWAFDPPTVLDDCGGTNVTITVLDTVTNGVCPQLITRTWLATDACSNSASCGQTITVADTTPPVITCATNKTVGCADAWTFDPPTASDTCCTNITILTLDTVTNGAPCTEIITRTWAALDCCSNIATCTQTVTVTNAFAPLVLNCATNFTVECGTAWSFTPPTATGGCCTNIVISIIDTVTNGVCPQVITRTWQAVDCCSNTATCSQTVTVVDTTPPLVNCGQNETLQCGSSWDFTVPIVSDACSAVTLQIFSTTTNALCGATFQATRVWLASDLCNNITTCTQIVTIIDVTPPVLTCATNKTVDCASAWIFDPPSAFDACGGTNVTIAVVGTVTNGSGCSQDITRTWQATDGCGNPSTCSQTVTLQDTAPPVVTCATNKTVECASAWTFDPPTATDNCCTNVAISILGTVTNGAACAEIITRTWLAADCCSNTATCSQTVTVVDTTPPVITCSTNRTVECGACLAGPGLPNYTILRSFATGADAQDPYASLAEGNDGALYGVTYSGGASGAGTIYKLEKDGSSYVVLHDFAASGAEGKNPVAALRRASVDGKFYGLTYQGGGGGGGTLFRLEPDGSGFTVLHDFASGDGLHPYGNLTVDVDSGILYGTALDGGANGFGTVFMVNRDGSGFTVLHSFAAAGDGRNPYGGVVQGVDGAFYGNTSGGGAAGLGTIYKLNPDGSGYAILHEFATTAGDGASPRSTLIQGSDLHLYGTTYGGGAAGFGTLYKMDTSGGGYAVIHNFPGVAGEGMNPVSRVVEGNDGALYGTTLAGGVAGSGTAYRIRTDGTDYSELHQFASYPGDGVQPHAGLVLATDGALYGTTRQGGIDGLGTVYRLACESAIIFDQPAALDACCGANVTITVLSTVTNGLCPKLITRTWQATDCCSNSATCSQTLTIADTTPPVLTCATNKTVLCGTAWTFDPPAAYDLCCGTNVSIAILDTVTNSSPSNSCSQVITRTWSATDCCSNTALCSQTVIINGPACVPPVITGVSLSGNTFYLSFQSLFGHSYAIEYKDGFSDPNWHLLQTVPGTGGIVTVQDTPASLEIRVYRVVCLGP